MERLKATLSRKVGPFTVGAWIVIVVAGVGIGLMVRRGFGSSGGGGGASVSVSEGDYEYVVPPRAPGLGGGFGMGDFRSPPDEPVVEEPQPITQPDKQADKVWEERIDKIIEQANKAWEERIDKITKQDKAWEDRIDKILDTIRQITLPAPTMPKPVKQAEPKKPTQPSKPATPPKVDPDKAIKDKIAEAFAKAGEPAPAYDSDRMKRLVAEVKAGRMYADITYELKKYKYDRGLGPHPGKDPQNFKHGGK